MFRQSNFTDLHTEVDREHGIIFAVPNWWVHLAQNGMVIDEFVGAIEDVIGDELV
jgi:hypothetical protein